MRIIKHNVVVMMIFGALWVSITSGICPAWAIDVQPRDYRYLPAGTNLAIVYYDYAHRGSADIDNGPTYNDGTNLDSHIGIFRYVYYTELAGVPFVLETLIPYGSLTNGKLGGNKLNSTTGFGDPYLAFVVWPYRNTEQGTDVAIGSYTQLPLGTYHRKDALNLGTNRWTQDFQASFTQSLGSSWTFEVEGDAIIYTDNGNANTEGQTLRQDTSWQLQSWLSYDITETSYIAAGYNSYYGGRQRVDGTPNGFKTSLQEIRATYAQFVTPTIQLLGSVYRDVAFEGGFRRDIGITFRILKVF